MVILKRFDPHMFVYAEVLENLLQVCLKTLGQVFVNYYGECDPNFEISAAAKFW